MYPFFYQADNNDINSCHPMSRKIYYIFLAPFEVLALVILGGTEFVGDPLLGRGMFKFQADPGIFNANVLGVAGGDPDLSLFRVEVSAVPIPATALLFTSGLIALIALRRQRA